MRAILLQGGNVVDPREKDSEKINIWIENGKVVKMGSVGSHLHVPDKWEVIDCEGLWVVPGLIDMHVHARTPGQEHKETLTTMSMAALAGGFTTIVAMANTAPAIDFPESMYQLLIKAERESFVNYFQVAAATVSRAGIKLVNMSGLVESGAIAFSDDGDGIQDPEIFSQVIFSAAEQCKPILLHCQDKRFDPYDKRSEIEDVSLASRIAEVLNCPIHIQHVSCAESVQLIRETKARGVKVTCETAPHYMALTQEDFNRIGSNAKMNPPLRGRKDRQAIIQGLVDGTIDVIATDHAPHTDEEKQSAKPPFGVIGLETAVPVVFSHLIKYMSAPQIIAKMTLNPARILGLKDQGLIQQGWPADITVIDPKKRKVLKSGDLNSKSHNSPWLGRRMQTWPVLTIRNGRICMRNGKILTHMG